MLVLVEFGLDLVTRSAFAVVVFFCRVFRIRIASLNHEPLDNAVKNGAVIEPLPCQLLEILNRIWRSVGPKLQRHFAFARLNHCDLI